MKQEYYLKFNDYTADPNKLPNESGIYLIRKTKMEDDARLSVKLLYIGKAENLNERFAYPNSHEGYVGAQEICDNSEDHSYVSISYALCSRSNLDRIEACLIHANRPALNTANKQTFDYDETIVYVSGTRKSNLNDINIAKRK